MASQIASGGTADQVTRLIASSRALADRLRFHGGNDGSGDFSDLRTLLQRVTVGKGRIGIALNRQAIAEELINQE